MVLSKEKITVLYADEAIAFGGSLVVVGHLVDAIDKDQFSPVVVGAMGVDRLKKYIEKTVSVYSIPRLYNYAHWAKTITILNRIPVRLVRKILNYLLSLVRVLLNSIYLAKLSRLIIKEKVDVIHINNGMNKLASMLAAVLLRRGFVVHILKWSTKFGHRVKAVKCHSEVSNDNRDEKETGVYGRFQAGCSGAGNRTGLQGI